MPILNPNFSSSDLTAHWAPNGSPSVSWSAPAVNPDHWRIYLQTFPADNSVGVPAWSNSASIGTTAGGVFTFDLTGFVNFDGKAYIIWVVGFDATEGQAGLCYPVQLSGCTATWATDKSGSFYGVVTNSSEAISPAFTGMSQLNGNWSGFVDLISIDSVTGVGIGAAPGVGSIGVHFNMGTRGYALLDTANAPPVPQAANDVAPEGPFLQDLASNTLHPGSLINVPLAPAASAVVMSLNNNITFTNGTAFDVTGHAKMHLTYLSPDGGSGHGGMGNFRYAAGGGQTPPTPPPAPGPVSAPVNPPQPVPLPCIPCCQSVCAMPVNPLTASVIHGP